jgi:glucose/arabinose dehydrogenase
MTQRLNSQTAAVLIAALLAVPTSAASQTREIARIGDEARVMVFATGLEHPWGLAFLPDGRALVTERPGRLRIVDRDGRLSAPLGGVPRVFNAGQGGLLDVALDPAFARNGLVYLSYAEQGPDGSGTAVARGRLTDRNLLTETMVIYRQQPKVESALHFGSRLVFARDGTLFVTQGDRYTYRDNAQRLDDTLGKLVRINPDGTVPADNPFVGKPGARPEIYSYGHRNLQGATLHPVTGRLWTHEHGAQGGDEINLPEPGRNYGWPVITHGVDYNGAKIGIGKAAPGMEQPVHFWVPSVAPSGMAFYSGDVFPQWNGNLFIGGLRSGMLIRLEIKDEKVAREHRYLEQLGERIRDVRQGPDGLIYLLTDSPDGKILRLEPIAK